MYAINDVALDFRPREMVEEKITLNSNDIEMTTFDSAFLCGLLEKFKPKKILELGVASGGTTAIILQCMEDLGLQYKVFSVDISDHLYRDEKRETGYVIVSNKDKLPLMHHKLCLGHSIPYFLDDIGVGIDFLVLDTTHFMPGEVLDFIAVLPYLKNDAVVCIHDIAISQAPELHQAHACSVLFQSVTGKKFMNFLPNGEYPNIAAFQTTSETRQNIMDVFCALMMRWDYIPSENELERYKHLIQGKYDQCCLEVYDSAVRRNAGRHRIDVRSILPKGSKIALYGAGRLGKEVLETLQNMDSMSIVKWVDRNYLNFSSYNGVKIDSPDSLAAESFDYVLVAASKTYAIIEIYENLCAFGIPFKKIRFLQE